MKTQDHAGDCGGSSYPRLSHPWCGEGWEWPRSCPEAQFACPGSWFGPYSACNCPLPPFSHGDIQIPLSTAYQHRCCSWLGGPIYSRVFPWLESLRTASPYSPSPVSPSDAPRPCDFQSQGAQEPTEDQGGPRAQLLWKTNHMPVAALRQRRDPCCAAGGPGVGTGTKGQQYLRQSGRQRSKIPRIKPKENKQIKKHRFGFSQEPRTVNRGGWKANIFYPGGVGFA